MSDPLPYIVSFFILFLVVLALLTWVIYLYKRSYECSTYANIWCWDDWSCNQKCQKDPSGTCKAGGKDVNSCFCDSQGRGLPSCLYGPDIPAAKVCYNFDSDPLACECPDTMKGAQQQGTVTNCLAGCAANLKEGVVNAGSGCAKTINR